MEEAGGLSREEILAKWPEAEADGCELDFTEEAIDDDEALGMLVAKGEEEDELDEEGEPLKPSSPDRGMATRLRRGAVILGTSGKPLFNVREVDGWKNRGRDFAGTQPAFNPLTSGHHHTAGPPRAAGRLAPSLGICTNGRSDLPGPLCNVLQAYNDTAIVIAAGVANHAGSGSWQGVEFNFHAYGLEVEHPGTSMVTDRRVLVGASIHACLMWRPTGPDMPPRMLWQHREWSTAGKIDFAKNFSSKAQADGFRKLVGQQLAKLNAISRWEVSFLNGERERAEAFTRDPAAWVKGHAPAMRRGRVTFAPRRG